MNNVRHRPPAYALLLLCAGCSLANESLLERFEGSSIDAGPEDAQPVTSQDSGAADASEGDASGFDAGPAPADRCEDNGDTLVLTDTTEDLVIDTRNNVSTISSLPSCGLQVPGSDAFVAVDVEPGTYWHFHLQTDPTAASDSRERDPTLYLLRDGCNVTQCQAATVADYCGSTSDEEHFGFEFPQAGRWFIGIDDRISGGGVYLLDAVRPVCGDGRVDHGEACDDAVEDGPACESCRLVLNEDDRFATGFNFNLQEAHLVEPSAIDGTPSVGLTIGGLLGGLADCSYPAYYAIAVEDGRPNLRVEYLMQGVDACDADGEAQDVTMVLETLGGGQPDANITSGACPTVQARLSEGLYFISIVDDREDRSRVVRYEVRFTLSP
ncbi:MAG: hypothetical protein AAF355_04630 [Myxococcota bacterium]